MKHRPSPFTPNVVQLHRIAIVCLLMAWVVCQGQTTDEYVVMDFEDTELHDETWFLSQPLESINHYVSPKGDSGSDALSLAVGEGRSGGNALLVEAVDAAAGLPGFWVTKGRNRGYHGNLKDERGYLLPSGQSANRMEFWVRFEDGYRAASSAAQPPSYPNHQNLHVGTYQFDPARIDGVLDVKESDNWHFYHQVMLRHDKAGDGWIRVVLNEMPQHQRSLSSLPPVNATQPAGNYWELLTRFYIDGVQYFADPEKAYPAKMWIDDIKLTYVEERTDIAIDIVGHENGESVGVARGVERDFTVTLTNATAGPLCGILSLATPYWMGPQLLDPQTQLNVSGAICLAANETRMVLLRINPSATASNTEVGELNLLGVSFVTDDQVLSDSESTNRSLTDANVERRWFPDTGPHDADIKGDFLRTLIIGGVDTTPPAEVSVATAASGDQSVALTWSNPADADFTGVLILQSAAPVMDAPATGNSYSVGDNIGPSSVVSIGVGEQHLAANLNNGFTYHFKLFTYDSTHNYSDGVSLSATPIGCGDDDTAPVILGCPQSRSVATDTGECSAMVSWIAPDGVDNCSSVTLSSSHASGSTFPLGTTTALITATDASANMSTCSFDITVSDMQAPSIVGCPDDLSVRAATNETSVAVSWTEPLITDNCGDFGGHRSHEPDEFFPIGSTEVVYSIDDPAGNHADCVFTVVVVENQEPVANDDDYTVVAGGTLDTGVQNLAAVTVNDTDVDGDPLTVSLLVDPQHGTVSLATDGTFVYTHIGDASVSDNFSYRIDDGYGGIAQAVVLIAIEPGIAIQDDFYSVKSGQEIDTTFDGLPGVSDNDAVDGVVSVRTSPEFGSLTLDPDGAFYYHHPGGVTEADYFEYTLTTATGEAAHAEVVIAPVSFDIVTATLDIQLLVPTAPATAVTARIRYVSQAQPVEPLVVAEGALPLGSSAIRFTVRNVKSGDYILDVLDAASLDVIVERRVDIGPHYGTHQFSPSPLTASIVAGDPSATNDTITISMAAFSSPIDRRWNFVGVYANRRWQGGWTVPQLNKAESASLLRSPSDRFVMVYDWRQRRRKCGFWFGFE